LNAKLGRTCSLLTGIGVGAFALSMLAGQPLWSYASGLLIALGFVGMIASFAALASADRRATTNAALVFAGAYATVIGVVYFAQLTAVRFDALAAGAAQILDFQRFGLFFYLDLLGYGFMAMATFLIALGAPTPTRADRWLRGLLLGHGVFALSCFGVPALGVFRDAIPGASPAGTLLLLGWCAYFLPISLLAADWFRRAGSRTKSA